MTTLPQIVRDAFAVEEQGLDWRSGLAGAVAAVGPLAAGVAVDDPRIGFTATIGALNTALVVPRAGIRARIFWGATALVGGCASAALSQLVADRLWTLLVATFLWVALWAFWRTCGRIGALLGFATAAVFVILSGLPATPSDTGQQVAWYAIGGAFGLVLMVAARRGPYAPPVGRAALAAYAACIRRDRSMAAHAGRLALAVTLGTLIDHLSAIHHGYWIPLTILAILQPDERATTIRVIQRAAGTLAAAAVILLITLVVDEPWLLLACGAVSAFGLYALDQRGYFWLVVLLTPTVLFMISAIQFEGDEVAIERVANSMLGIAIGLAIGELFWRGSRRRATLPA